MRLASSNLDPVDLAEPGANANPRKGPYTFVAAVACPARLSCGYLLQPAGCGLALSWQRGRYVRLPLLLLLPQLLLSRLRGP